jgi:serine protease AprX
MERTMGMHRDTKYWRRAAAAATGLALLIGVLAPTTATADDLDTSSAPDPTRTSADAYGAARWDVGRTEQPTSMATVNQAIGADKLHRAGITGAGVGVALIDTGVVPVDGLLTPGKVVEGPDLSFESQAPGLLHLDTFGHGTHLAGIIAGDGTDFTGVAPGAQLVSLKVATYDGAVDVTQVIAAIDWVVQHRDELGIRVLNLAYGTDSTQPYTTDPLAYAVENAWQKGIVVVTSAGNDGRGIPLNNPASDPYVIAVGASDTRQTPGVGDDIVPAFSADGVGRTTDLVAPGQSVVSLRNPGSYIDTRFPSAVVGDRFFRGTGTSQSAAVVSGAAALLLEQRPGLSPDDVKALLMGTAGPIQDSAAGAGALDVHRAARSELKAPSAQTWPASDGLGSIEASRGTSHVADDGVELVGEYDIFGMEWDGRSWTQAAWEGRSWTGGEWMGRSWTGDSWTADSWSGRSWTGRSWTGRSWTGRSWTGRSWTGRSWTGRSWTGDEWGGRSWTGRSWTGRSWTSRTWI